MTNKEIVKRLKKARKLIETGEHWTQGSSFRDNDDNPLWGPEQFKKATKFCAIGAMLKNDVNSYILSEAGDKLYGEHHTSIINDIIGLDAILTCFDYAIDKLENE